jgi:two-component system phosphate regulon response regulator PhoB
MPRQKVLIVEDDLNISKLVRYNLEKAEFECSTATSGEAALETLNAQQFDLVVLDIMLPKMDGLEVCRTIKQNPNLKDVPIVMLTAKGEEIDRVVGLELGADDYIVKPFSPREFVLRIKAVLRRGVPAEQPEMEILKAPGLVADIPKHKVVSAKKEIELTAMEFRLLTTLMKRRGRVQTRDQLLTDVWGINDDVDTRTIDTHVKRLREKLGKAGELIETIRGLGYRFREEDAD